MAFAIFPYRRSGRDEITDDHFIFRLHYRFTVFLLLLLGFVLGLVHYTTEKIMCSNKSNIFDELCWSHGNLTVVSSWTEYHEWEQVVRTRKYDPSTVNKTMPPPPPEDLRHYQLIFCKLIFHAVFFYLPRLLWKLWEGEKIKTIAKDLEGKEKDSSKAAAISLVAEYLRKHTTEHDVRLMLYTLCELLNFINVVAHLVIFDRNFGDILSTHGIDLIGLTNTAISNRTDSLLNVFPRMVHCRYSTWGVSGYIEDQSTICLLHNNSLAEKVFAVVLIWLLVLSVLSGSVLIYRIVMLASVDARLYVLGARCRHVPRNTLIRAARGMGDWFILYQLSKHIGVLTFTELVNKLGTENDDGGHEMSGIV